MRKRFWILTYTIIVIFVSLLQTSFLPQFDLFWVKPDLVLLFVAAAGLLKGFEDGITAGAIAGVTVGIISGNPWGLYILAYCLVGFAAGLVSEKIMMDNIIVPVLSGVVSTLIFAAIFSFVGPFFDIYYLAGADFYRLLFYLLWNVVFSIPILLLSRYLLLSTAQQREKKGAGISKDYIVG